MPARICPDCHRPHNNTSLRCSTCYQCRRLRGKRRRARRPYTPPPCGDGLCGHPATEPRLITVGLKDHSATHDTGWLFLCPACAALFDQDEDEDRTNVPIITPSRSAARGSIYC